MSMLRRLSVGLVVVAMVWGTFGVLPPQAADAAEEGSAAFVSEFWRMFVHQVEVGAEPAELGLTAESESDLVVAIIDATNLGTSAADLALDEFGLQAGATEDPVPAEQTAEPSAELRLSDVEANGTVSVDVDSTVRVAAAFWLPQSSAEAEDLSLTFQDVGGNGQLDVTVAGEAQTVPLLAATTPPLDGCFGAESSDAILSLTGGSVFVEADPTSDGQLVWFWDAEAGHLRLLNQALIEQGFGAYDDEADESAYGLWLSAKGEAARDDETGLWADCRDAAGTYINPPTQSPEEVRGEYTEIDPRDLVIRPDTFIGEKIVVSGEVFNIQVEGGATAMQIWVADYEAVGVYYEGDSTGIYEGTYVTVYGVGRGTFTGENAFGATITQPLIEADIVDF